MFSPPPPAAAAGVSGNLNFGAKPAAVIFSDAVASGSIDDVGHDPRAVIGDGDGEAAGDRAIHLNHHPVHDRVGLPRRKPRFREKVERRNHILRVAERIRGLDLVDDHPIVGDVNVKLIGLEAGFDDELVH